MILELSFSGKIENFLVKIKNELHLYVLLQVPTPLHSIHPVDKARQTELQSYLAYLEGCYGGLPTL